MTRRLEDPELERKALGGILAARGRKDHLVALLAPEAFTEPRYRAVFRAMVALGIAKRPVGQATLEAALRQIDAAPAIVALPEIETAVPSSTNAEHYVDELREVASLRRIAELRPHAIVAEAQTAAEAAANLRAQIDAIDAAQPAGGPVSGDELARGTVARLDAARATPGVIRGLPTGLERLDRLLSGLRSAGLYIGGARPGMGKTSFALQVALEAALRQAKRALVFSLEMSKEELADRILAIEGRVSTEQVPGARFEAGDWPRISRVLSDLAESGLYVDDRGGLKIDELFATARRLHADAPLGLVVVDYLQLVRASEKRKESREQEVAEVSRKLKALAKALHAPVLALSQLNRENEKRSGHDRRPRLSDLRESGAIEADADAVLALHRPAEYDDAADPTLAEVLVLKHRHGRTGLISLHWHAEQTRFANRMGTP